MNTFSLKVIACDRIFYENQSSILIVPAPDGQLAILPHHENVVAAINAGEIRFQTGEGKWLEAICGIGFVQVMNNRVTVLVDTVELPEEIDVARAKAAEERAKERLRQKQSLQQYYRSKASLSKAMARLSGASKHKHI